MVEQINGTEPYIVGDAADELRRLDLQGEIFRPHTERLLWDAGIGPGMRVLDVGCGTGAVTTLVASLVGPSGEIVGVDRSAEALETAERQVAARGLRQVRFVEGDIAEMAGDEPFDAIVGRFVLLHLRTPVTALRRLATLLRPGGVVAFQEIVIPTASLSTPPHPLGDRMTGWIRESLARAGANPDMGLHLPAVFAAAGLPIPQLRLDGVLTMTADPAFMDWGAGTTRSLLQAITGFGVATAAEVGIETLAERLTAEHADVGGVLCPLLLGGASVRTPHA